MNKQKIAWIYPSISNVKPEDGYIFALYGGAEEYRIEECASMKGACDYCDFKKQPECMSCKCCDRLNGKQYVFKKLTKNEKILYTSDHETFQKYNEENNND